MTDARPLFGGLLALLLLLAGCGYHLVGTGGGAERIALTVTRFEDESREPLFGPQFLRELSRRGVERSDVSMGSGGLSLEVKIFELKEIPGAFSKKDIPSEYMISARMDLQLKEAGKTVWKNVGLTGRREFAAGTNIASTRANKDRALALLADDLAGETLRRAVDGARNRNAGSGASGEKK